MKYINYTYVLEYKKAEWLIKVEKLMHRFVLNALGQELTDFFHKDQIVSQASNTMFSKSVYHCPHLHPVE